MAIKMTSEIGKSELTKVLLNELAHKYNCCDRCLLRYMGERNTSAYLNYSSVYQSLIERNALLASDPVEQGKKKLKLDGKFDTESCCACCLGVLSDKLSGEHISEQVLSSIKEAGFEFSDFQFAVILPTCISIREKYIEATIRQRFSALKTLTPEGDLDCENSSDIDSFLSSVCGSYVGVKDAWKWSVGPALEQKTGCPFKVGSAFEILITFEYSDDKLECENFALLLPKSEPIARRKTRPLAVSKNVFARLVDSEKIPILTGTLTNKLPECNNIVTMLPVKCSHDSIYVAGRYNKYSRRLSQTPWVVDGERRLVDSVKELISLPLEQHIPTDEVKFSSSGREDVDVLCLGIGRPFVLEFLNPRRCLFDQNTVSKWQEEINASTKVVAVRDLQVVPKCDLGVLKHGEEERCKTYRAICYASHPITQQILDDKINSLSSQEVKLEQKTPIRVLHRRPLATRIRSVHDMRATMIVNAFNAQHFELLIRTQAGTYVKEFVHGDFGRTQPNMCSLLGFDVDIIQLDVMSIELDWPPSLQAVC